MASDHCEVLADSRKYTAPSHTRVLFCCLAPARAHSTMPIQSIFRHVPAGSAAKCRYDRAHVAAPSGRPVQIRKIIPADLPDVGNLTCCHAESTLRCDSLCVYSLFSVKAHMARHRWIHVSACLLASPELNSPPILQSAQPTVLHVFNQCAVVRAARARWGMA